MQNRQSLSALKRIRVLINSGPGSGTQSASINLMRYLVDRGFKGIFEVIYAAPIKPIIANLLDADESQLNTVYNNENLRIEFIELNDMVNNRHSGNLPELHLGVTGAIEGTPGFLRSPYFFSSPDNTDGYISFNSSALEDEAKNNFAIFLNVTSFVCFNPYTDEYSDTYIDHKNNNRSLQIGSGKKISFYPPYHFKDAIEYLLNNKIGKSLTEQLPALLPLIELISNNKINFIPVYGRGTGEEEAVRTYYRAAQYAQLNGGLDFQKPIVVGIFDKQVINGSNVIHMKDMLDIDSIKRDKDKAYILFSDRIPSLVFNAMVSHPNALSPIFEGTGSFNSLLLTGKTHLHWKLVSSWPLLSRNLTDSLRNKFTRVNEISCLFPRDRFKGWPPISQNMYETVTRDPNFRYGEFSSVLLNYYLDKIESEKEEHAQSGVVLGEYFLDSRRKSEVSDFFVDLPQQAVNEDRFAYGLEPVVKLGPLSDSYKTSLDQSKGMLADDQQHTSLNNSANLFGMGVIALAGVLIYGLFGRCRHKYNHQNKFRDNNKNNMVECASRVETRSLLKS